MEYDCEAPAPSLRTNPTLAASKSNMADNFAPASPNDIDWAALVDFDPWSDMQAIDFDFMQGAGSGLGEAE
ncbi:hypothetical protein OEA41_004697 [Lepraria neglecta]|uniref:Uncharacterized protein n=1 Tax=Lepraria neglecta TaxID=209136 RepID=A0AAE0DG03_9LECA|nr:hypothetical protein OEA41_004697 [Lepraria neglecta]